MNYELCIKNRSSRLALIFAGWGMDARPFAGVEPPEGYDMGIVWDYTDLSAPWADALGERYEEIAVFAWSFGVPAASAFIAAHPGLPITARVAVNGTQHPVDDSLGIPAAIYRATLDGLDDRSLRKFRMRMCGGAASYADTFATCLPCRTVGSLRAELDAISSREYPVIQWDRAFISDGDLIIPPSAQARAWQTEACMTDTIHGPHLPDFGGILARCLTEKPRVARRFGVADHTYDSAATVQRDIATRLLAMLPPLPPSAKVLEIGPGTGFSTVEIARRGPLARFEAWDLHLHPSLVSRPGVTAVECDAETRVIGHASEAFDLVYSASAIQWFNSLPAFLRRLEQILAPGGRAILSTFGPLTMQEIHTALGTLSTYPDTTAITRMIPPGLHLDSIAAETHTLTFDSPLDVLRHIRLTGVGGNARSLGGNAAARRLLSAYPLDPEGRAPLTYQPVYISITRHP